MARKRKPKSGTGKKINRKSLFLAVAFFILGGMAAAALLMVITEEREFRSASPRYTENLPRPTAEPTENKTTAKTPADTGDKKKKADKPVMEKKAPGKSAFEKARGKLAIIIDDVGINQAAVKPFMEIKAPLTFSILPFRPYSKKLAEEIYLAGQEVMLHLPMEPEPETEDEAGPGKGALLTAHTPERLKEITYADIAAVPFAKGANNHMGSLFTARPEKLKAVMEELREARFYFVDSFTTPNSRAMEVARKTGLQTVARDVFLDNDRDPAEIERMLRHAVETAIKTGKAVAIGHPYPETATAIKNMEMEFFVSGVELVFVSDMVE